MEPKHILIVEDEHALGTALGFAVRRIGHLPTLAATGAAALRHISCEAPALVVLDIGLPDMSGLEVVRHLRQSHPALPVLMVTAHGTLHHAIAARQHGATEYLVKPLDLRQFEQTVHSLLSKPGSLPTPAPLTTEEPPTVTLIGTAPSLREVFTGIARACASDNPVLLSGETGTGKSLAAKLIHSHGKQSAMPLNVVTSDVLPESPCTALLEDVTSLPANLQMELATRMAEPDGIRWIASTSLEPRAAMECGLLRAELYYAFSPLHISLPPLKERTGDIAALACYFLDVKQSTSTVSDAALTALEAFDWPGNVRQLRQVLLLAADLADGGIIYPSHLPPEIGTRSAPVHSSTELESTLNRWLTSRAPDLSYDQLMDELETVVLRQLLARHDGKPTHLAAALQMNRATLRQKLRRLGLGGGE